jgi:hypothetical protein
MFDFANPATAQKQNQPLGVKPGQYLILRKIPQIQVRQLKPLLTHSPHKAEGQ